MAEYDLTEQDEFSHSPTADSNFNESVYVNGIDHGKASGFWMRLGNRVNEGYAELQLCFYLPDGRLACQFLKPEITDNKGFSAGGMHYEVNEPLSAVSMGYRGEAMILDDTNLLREPKRLFSESAKQTLEIEASLQSVSPIYGGAPRDDEQITMYGRDFSLGHFFQHMRTKASITLDGQHYSVDGLGWRDHSWGPRYWTNINFYRLFIVNFDNGDGFTMLKITDRNGNTRRVGVMNIDGQFEQILDVDLVTDWSDYKDPEKITLGVRTQNRAAILHGEVTTLAPLRNRRKLADGTTLETRIAEGFTKWSWDGMSGYGLSEYIERVENNVPIGYPV
ncbi:MAG: DUF7064 domain-containing protein [Gammaproteobacteria bacterium]